MDKFNSLSEKLSGCGITPSIHRVEILDYLLTHRDHPTAEQIFQALKEKVGSLSRATVYNTLALFAEKGVVKVLTVDGTENRYDIETARHGHFICTSCKAVCDVDINIDGSAADKLEGYKITDVDVYFKGICPRCLLNN